jgi:hypothetical protein
MDPLTFEAIMFLKLNDDLWGPVEIAEARGLEPQEYYGPGSGKLQGDDEAEHGGQYDD